jgi:hypothetical protein
VDTDDRKLDALLERAAPTAPPGFAAWVLAAAHARRRRRRLWIAGLAAAGAAVVCIGLWAVLGRRRDEDGGRRARVPELAGMREGGQVAARPESFAVELPAARTATHRVMMGRADGTYVIVVRPIRAPRDCPPGRRPAMAGAVMDEMGARPR